MDKNEFVLRFRVKNECGEKTKCDTLIDECLLFKVMQMVNKHRKQTSLLLESILKCISIEKQAGLGQVRHNYIILSNVIIESYEQSSVRSPQKVVDKLGLLNITWLMTFAAISLIKPTDKAQTTMLIKITEHFLKLKNNPYSENSLFKPPKYSNIFYDTLDNFKT